MKKNVFYLALLISATLVFAGCAPDKSEQAHQEDPSNAPDFEYLSEQFADLKIIRYQIPGWDELPLQQKKLAYFLTQAGLSGRDIIYDQNYRHNLRIRRTLEDVYTTFDGDKSSEEWKAFEVYLKRIWFSNGIHHHYSYDKFTPDFSRDYLVQLLEATGKELSDEVLEVIFNPEVDAKKVSKDASKDLVLASAVNFYDPDLTQQEVEAFYSRITSNKDPERPISYGLNSKLVRNDAGEIEEKVWKIEGMYSPALERVVYWLEKAVDVAENDKQRQALQLLIEYYRTGNLKTWDDFNVAWVEDTASTVDYINGFVEVYNDPLGYKGSYENIVEIRDLGATQKMKVLAEHAQYFEDNSPILNDHKKDLVKGITYNFINVAGESGDASPATPIGVNLPNANWIRAEHGSKSVSLGNIVSAYEEAGTKGFLEEFSHDSVEIAWAKAYARQADKLHTALHEVIGHASGKLEPGVGEPKETLKNYSSTLEEGRADLVALYYLMDPKLVELGVMDNLDVGKQAYDDYIKNGLMLQLRRVQPGEVIEEDHMRNRQMVAAWVFEKGAANEVISRVERDGKTYFEINDYEALQNLFGELLREVQRIKSEGDYEAGKALVESYGVQVNETLHQEVLERAAQFRSAPYGGFINPYLEPVEEDGEIVDIKASYPDNFTEQMLHYRQHYTFLPDYN